MNLTYFKELFSTPRGAVAQSVGFCAMLLALFIYSFRERKKVLVTKLTSDIIWTLHYILLGQLTAAFINIVSTGRELVFYNRGSRKWASYPIWPAIFIALNVASTILSGGSFTPKILLPVTGSSVAVIGLWQNNMLKLRILNFVGVSMWFVYSLLIDSPFSVINNIFALTSITIGLCRDISQIKKSANNTRT